VPAETEAAAASGGGDAEAARRPTGLFRNTAIFSVATGLSRIAGLVREIVAAAYYGTTGTASAFTIAFQVPNLIRALVADAALSSAFVPVFTQLRHEGREAEARQLASALLGLILVALGAITVVFMLGASVVMPLFTSAKFSPAEVDLTVGLSRVLFPIIVLLGVNGLAVGILSAYDHFSIPAIAPLVWNLVIIAGMVLLRGLFDGADQIYAYAIGVLAGTLVQLLMVLPVLRSHGVRLRVSLKWDDPRIRQVLKLMLPVSISLGVINVDLLINSRIGALVSDGAPRAIDAAFRIYMLPQGMFSVAVATVLFPQLARLAAGRDLPGLRRWSGNGMRLIFLALIPCAAATIALAEPITRLVYERGAFGDAATEDVSEALFWFSFSLPFAGANLMLTRTFFSLQRPWFPTALAGGSLVVNAAVSLALYRPLGIAGVVIGTAVSSLTMTLLQAFYLRRELHGFEVVRTLRSLAEMVAAAVALGLVTRAAWSVVDDLLGRSLIAQVVSVGLALALGFATYGALVVGRRVPEARQLSDLIAARLRR
jgi:putative peptidoglycan lipid II flippase